MLSGLNGKAITLKLDDIPSKSVVRDVVPDRCFTRQTSTSIAYLIQSLSIQIIIVVIGLSIPVTGAMFPVWIIYAVVSGTTAMGFWVIAHECGHGAFSDNRKLETIIGYVLHSFLLVPYFSWQRSHSIHHRFTNHITDGETYVPLVIDGNGTTEKSGGENDLAASRALGKTQYGVRRLLSHLFFGWPAYLLAGKTGGPSYGMSNHFWPRAPFSKKLWPSIWAKKVWLSDIGVGFVLLALLAWAFQCGIASVITLYLGPLLMVNVWLVVYTWLHHTDTDVPHLAGSDFSFMRGAFLSIDRPYGKILDFLHHRIGSTHAIHHISPNIPHYHAREATLAIKKAFPKVYLFSSSPIYLALWNVASTCIAVQREEGSSRYYWKQP